MHGCKLYLKYITLCKVSFKIYQTIVFTNLFITLEFFFTNVLLRPMHVLINTAFYLKLVSNLEKDDINNKVNIHQIVFPY